MAPVENWCYANRTLCAKCSHKKVTPMQNWLSVQKWCCVKVTCKINLVGTDFGGN